MTQKLGGAFKLDDGTGAIDVVTGLQKDAPLAGLDLGSVTVGDYVLVVGKVVPNKQGTGLLGIKLHKVGAAPAPVRRPPDGCRAVTHRLATLARLLCKLYAVRLPAVPAAKNAHARHCPVANQRHLRGLPA